MQTIPIKRALFSVSDKSGCAAFAKTLHDHGIEIISTGGTSQVLQAANIPHQAIETLTGWPEMLDGRVKTLHPLVHGGILGKRDEHALEAEQHGIAFIDLVVVNFYPFESMVGKCSNELTWAEAVEYIDIGGPTLVRAAAKNFAWVGVITDPADYALVLAQLKQYQGLSFSMREQLAEKAFAVTARYDAMVNQYFINKRQTGGAEQNKLPQQLTLHLEKQTDLRYGENAHQSASAYRLPNTIGLLSVTQHQGKPLSYNNLLDADAAYQCVQGFDKPACVIVKHTNPCGAAIADSIDLAYAYAFQADAKSAFGGIVALNRPCTLTIAEAMAPVFMEVVIAPAFTPEALAVFAAKPNLRLLSLPAAPLSEWEMRMISGGMLVQTRDQQPLDANALQVVTQTQPNEEQIRDLLFAWQVVKHVKSNAILLASNQVTVGIGAGQVSRIDAVELALRKAGQNKQACVLASDAFFPLRDSIGCLAESNVCAIIQPGGSVRDEEVIAACNELGIAMVVTGKRCFKH